MDKAKAAVTSFLHNDGKHKTTVHETVNPAVQTERVTPTQHEQATTAVDREIHQEHHHTSVQPIKDREVLPTQHTHNVAPTEHRHVKEGNDDHVKQKLAAEQAQFKNTSEVAATQHSASAAPTVTGEHVHHHIHENIQPVIQKETIQPTVVHTTVPIHEVRHNEAKHHAASTLPPVTLSEFQKQGGSVTGHEERTDAFAGEPRSTGNTLGGHGALGTTSLTEKEAGATSAASHNSSSLTASSVDGETSKKPSLMDKLNPKKDANHDGKAGVLS